MSTEMIGLLSAIVGAVAGFFGGAQYQKSKTNQSNINLKSGNNSKQNVAGGNITNNK